MSKEEPMATQHDSSREIIRSFNPYTGQVEGEVLADLPEELSQTLRAAAAVSDDVASRTPFERAAWLRAIASRLEAEADDIIVLADRETGLGLPRLRAELARTADQLRFYAAVGEDCDYLDVARDTATERFPDLVRVGLPLGVVAVFGASNFPLAFGVLGHDTASAIAAGCPVVTKAHPAHPLLSRKLHEVASTALHTAGAPHGTLMQVTGWEAGLTLARAPEIAAVGFTGSQKGGLALWRAAQERKLPIPVYAEMGTVNPVVLTRGACQHADDLADGFVEAFMLGAGQYCTKPGLLLLPAGTSIPGRIASAVRAAPPAAMLSESIAAAATAGVNMIEAAGARILASAPPSPTGWSSASTVLTAPASALVPGSALLEECFGPVALIVEYSDETERDHVLSVIQNSLVATVMTDRTGCDPEAMALVRTVAKSVGRVTVDTWSNAVAWTWAQHHGGPWPSTSNPAATSVGAGALRRWVRPVVYQSTPDAWLPAAGQRDNPWQLSRTYNGVRRATKDHVVHSLK